MRKIKNVSIISQITYNLCLFVILDAGSISRNDPNPYNCHYHCRGSQRNDAVYFAARFNSVGTVKCQCLPRNLNRIIGRIEGHTRDPEVTALCLSGYQSNKIDAVTYNKYLDTYIRGEFIYRSVYAL